MVQKILDISRLGMRIITGKSLDILEGERLEVTFMLNDPGKSNVPGRQLSGKAVAG